MSNSESKIERRRLRNAYISTVVSITLVLFMLGCLGTGILYSKKLGDYVKENIGFSIYLKDKVKEVDVAKLTKSLDAEIYVKSTEMVNKEDAAKDLREELGEDFVDFLGYNPLRNSIDIHLQAEYANADSVAWISEALNANPQIDEVHYMANLLDVVDRKSKKISFIILVISALLCLVAVALINSSIRLAVYSKRFLIRSMQLVGATRGFVRRPFILKGIVHGIYGAILAIGLLSGLLYYAQDWLPELIELNDLNTFGILFGMVILLGIIISWISTYFAVNKYLGMKPKHMY